MTSYIFNSDDQRGVKSQPSLWLSWLSWLLLMILCIFFVETGLPRLYRTPTPQSVEAGRLDNSTKIIFLGTSRTQTNINPMLYSKKTVNVSEAAVTFSVMKPLLEAVLQKATGARLLIVECTAESFAYTYDDIPHRFERSLAPFGFVTQSGFFRGAKDAETFVNRWLPHIFSFRLTPRQLTADAPFFRKPTQYQSGHKPLDRRLNSAQALHTLQGTIEMIEGTRKKQGTDKNQGAFRAILELAHQRGIRVALLRHPVHQIYRDEIPREWELLLQQVLRDAAAEWKTSGLTILDESRHFEGDDSKFADFEHLNGQGAEAFSKNLLPVIEDLAREK